MESNPVKDLYDRFVKIEDLSKPYVLADDTSPEVEICDHLETPWMVKAINYAWKLEYYVVTETRFTVPLSKRGPTLVVYWLCPEPLAVIKSPKELEIAMPYGRLAVIYYDQDGSLVFTQYRAY